MSRSSSQGFEIFASKNGVLEHHDGACQFIYKGYQISASSHGYSQGSCLNGVRIFCGEGFQINATEIDFHSIEAAINWINEQECKTTSTECPAGDDERSAGVWYTSSGSVYKLKKGRSYRTPYLNDVYLRVQVQNATDQSAAEAATQENILAEKIAFALNKIGV